MDGGDGRLMRELKPGPDELRGLRDALGRYATGVTVVTAPTPGGPIGITANSFASVSLDPPLVLWSPARASRRFRFFCEAEHFAIHILGDDQQDLCDRFARTGHEFDGADWLMGAHGVPLLSGCLARFECRHAACHDGGDHAIIVGEVRRASWRDGEPLIFSQGCYGRFTNSA